MKKLGLTIALLSTCAIASAEDDDKYGDLAFAMRYSELCKKYDANANEWAVKLYQDFEKAGVDFNKSAAEHMGSVNYNRGMVDGYVAAMGDIAKACGLLKNFVRTKL